MGQSGLERENDGPIPFNLNGGPAATTLSRGTDKGTEVFTCTRRIQPLDCDR